MKRILILFLVLLAGVCEAAPRAIVLITIDTLRASHLGCYGYRQNTSPNIDALAKQSLRFEQAYTPAPLTLPAHASILTGLYPAHHGMRDNAFFEAAPVEVSTLLKNLGYATAAFISGAPLLARFGLAGGFDVYDDGFSGKERKADATTAAAVQWMQSQKGPYFVWVHYYDPHAEYEPPQEFNKFDSPYDGEIAYVDSRIPLLLKAAGKDAVVILTADHGESLGDHGESTHGFFLYDATLRVPLLVRAPGVAPATRTEPATLCDIAPTILQAAGGKATGMDGVSLLSKIAGTRWLLAESLYAARNFGTAPLYAAIRDRHKYILAPRPEFYDLAADPGEKNNILSSGKTETYAEAARTYGVSAVPAESKAMSEEDREKLRSLGYVGGSRPSGSADPKDRIEQAEQINAAMGALSRGDSKAAAEQFQAIVSKDPRNALGYRFLGDSLSAQNRFGEAVAAYARSWDLQPDPETGIKLAKSEFQAGQKLDAELALLKAAKKFPGYDPVAFELASYYESLGKIDIALKMLSHDSPETHNQRGILLLRLKNYSKAEEEFRKALAARPKAEYWNNLGLVLQRLDLAEDAAAAYREALAMDPGYRECESNLAFLLVQTQQWQLALSHLEHLTKDNPQMWNVRLARAYALENLGRTDEAVQAYSDLLRDAPQDWPQRAQAQSRLDQLRPNP